MTEARVKEAASNIKERVMGAGVCQAAVITPAIVDAVVPHGRE